MVQAMPQLHHQPVYLPHNSNLAQPGALVIGRQGPVPQTQIIMKLDQTTERQKQRVLVVTLRSHLIYYPLIQPRSHLMMMKIHFSHSKQLEFLVCTCACDTNSYCFDNQLNDCISFNFGF